MRLVASSPLLYVLPLSALVLSAVALFHVFAPEMGTHDSQLLTTLVLCHDDSPQFGFRGAADRKGP